MPCYLITYDLDDPGQDYDALYDLIKSYPAYLHALDSTWFIVTDEKPVEIRDYLKTAMDKNDKLYVGKVSGSAWTPTIGKKASAWLKENL